MGRKITISAEVRQKVIDAHTHPLTSIQDNLDFEARNTQTRIGPTFWMIWCANPNTYIQCETVRVGTNCDTYWSWRTHRHICPDCGSHCIKGAECSTCTQLASITAIPGDPGWNEDETVLTVHDDSCQTIHVLNDIDPDDVAQLRAELPIGWHFAEIDG